MVSKGSGTIRRYGFVGVDMALLEEEEVYFFQTTTFHSLAPKDLKEHITKQKMHSVPTSKVPIVYNSLKLI